MTGGPITLDEKGQDNGIQIPTLQNLEGKVRVNGPAAFAEAEPVLPVPGWRAG